MFTVWLGLIILQDIILTVDVLRMLMAFISNKLQKTYFIKKGGIKFLTWILSSVALSSRNGQFINILMNNVAYILNGFPIYKKNVSSNLDFYFIFSVLCYNRKRSFPFPKGTLHWITGKFLRRLRSFQLSV